MSEAYPETISSPETHPASSSRPRLWSRWSKWILLVLVCLWLVAEGISLLIQHTRLRTRLNARLEAAFGRSVDVGRYEFSFWGGPVLDAQSVTVGEDPRFGHEYFLRAESMAVRLRWSGLLRGRMEIGTLSLSRPSLNLVRDAQGDWNLAEWLPRPASASAPATFVGPRIPAVAPRFRRIEVDGGRINFKLGDEKLPFALVGVSGAVESGSPGLWRMDLTASPYRAAVLVQQAGTLHVSGSVGGTSSRLRPASLVATWTDASLPDVLRLLRGDDLGVRGTIALAASARTQENSDDWALQGRADLRQIHRWDLPLRSDNPSLNLIAGMQLHPATSSLDLTSATVEAPHSNIHGSGRIAWSRALPAKGRETYPVETAVSSSQIDLNDLLAWIRAFHPGVADDVSLRGVANVSGVVSIWPPRVESALVLCPSADIVGAALRSPAHLGPVQLRYDGGKVSFAPATLSWTSPPGQPASSVKMDLSPRAARGSAPAWHVAASASQVGDLVATANAFGWNIAGGWDFAGPFAADLRWQGTPLPQRWAPVGSMDFGGSSGASLRAPFLNQPIEQIKAHMELKPDAAHVALASVQAFGAHWSGTLDRRGADPSWQFALSADRLVAADFDRWLNPRWRESFLGRMLPFLDSSSSATVSPEGVHAGGRLSIGQFTLAGLVAHNLAANVTVDGRHIEVADAAGQLYGGAIRGLLTADLGAAPAYHADVNLTRVDVPALVAAAPALTGLAAESGTAEISFDARGASRDDLAASLACQGNAHVSGLALRNFDLWRSVPAALETTITRFPAASATFSCSRRTITFQTLSLVSGTGGAAEGTGTADFTGDLNLHLQVKSTLPDHIASPGASFRVTGSLASLQVSRIPPLARRAAR